MVLRVHERVMDAGRRPHGAVGGKASGAYGFSWLHTCLPASRRRPHGGTAPVQPAIGLRAALTGYLSEVGRSWAVGNEAQLSARRARPPLRVDRGFDGVRPGASVRLALLGAAKWNSVVSSLRLDAPEFHFGVLSDRRLP